MKELTFIRKNIDKWQAAENVVSVADIESPDNLANIYTDITADLAFAQTHYPTSRITEYLNNLASALHNEIYSNKREKWSRIITFWTREVPTTMYEARKLLLLSFIIMTISASIGVLSQSADSDFARLILGDNYVDMTLYNIANGTPMAVYDGGNESDMFLNITINNIFVSFKMFIFGLFTSIGTGLALFQNGLMLGSFLTFFFQHGLLYESFLAIFLHGTLEISALIVAGAGGIAFGNSFIFPGTYSRMVAFRRGAKRGLKIVVGTVPIFIVAGFIEGFITRHTEIANGIRLSIIIASLTFIIYYYIVRPYMLNKSERNK